MKEIFLACILLLAPAIAGAQDTASVTLKWDPNTEADLAGYKVYDCIPAPAPCSIAQHSGVEDVGNLVTITLPGIFQEGSTFFVTAYDASGNESGPSNKVTVGIPPADPSGLTITITIQIQP